MEEEIEKLAATIVARYEQRGIKEFSARTNLLGENGPRWTERGVSQINIGNVLAEILGEVDAVPIARIISFSDPLMIDRIAVLKIETDGSIALTE
ncbi:hypothetical protein [Leptospira stimsonii]|uniref:Uncharacterized protein n=1 Tax=Leptospira stimsonii TaxID=2202203 RepID=A0ABY2N2G1_9LEPT|nr:hypothetical protein [Leptospira stimsonii]TGK12813.1 hypothetical protein EHO98_19430 [Leptospira stimsonii]TGM14465.1 hypothetical protein EHQ90_11360 [Leptospira stimsonii]